MAIGIIAFPPSRATSFKLSQCLIVIVFPSDSREQLIKVLTLVFWHAHIGAKHVCQYHNPFSVIHSLSEADFHSECFRYFRSVLFR